MPEWHENAQKNQIAVYIYFFLIKLLRDKRTKLKLKNHRINISFPVAHTNIKGTIHLQHPLKFSITTKTQIIKKRH